MSRAVALVSGGLDSCVALAEAVERHPGAVAALHAGYGQRTAPRERQAFLDIATHYGIDERLEVDLSYLRAVGGSSLTDPDRPLPESEVAGSGVPSTYVPFRNACLLAAAVAWAEGLGAIHVVWGAHAPSSAYPDTQPAFVEAFNRLVEVATPAGNRIQVLTPLLHLDKAAIVRRGVERKAPLALTWSCYQCQNRPCGRCHSCRLRAAGFAAAQLPDPLESTC